MFVTQHQIKYIFIFKYLLLAHFTQGVIRRMKQPRTWVREHSVHTLVYKVPISGEQEGNVVGNGAETFFKLQGIDKKFKLNELKMEGFINGSLWGRQTTLTIRNQFHIFEYRWEHGWGIEQCIYKKTKKQYIP